MVQQRDTQPMQLRLDSVHLETLRCVVMPSQSQKRILSMEERPDDPLTHAHFARFGAIVHTFARIEYLMQTMMGRMAGIDPNITVVLTKALTYAQKRDTLLSYFEMFKLPEGLDKNEIKALFDKAHNHNTLRNHIAHSLWRHGTRPGSVKPGYIDLRFGRGHIGGYEEDDRDYTLDELGAIADELLDTRSEIIQYMKRYDKRLSP